MIKQSFPMRVLWITFIVLALPLLVDSFHFFQRTYEERVQRAKIDLREVAYARSFMLYHIQPSEPKILKEVGYIINQTKGNKPLQEVSQTLTKLSSITKNIDFFIVEKENEWRFKIIASSLASSIHHTIISYKRLPSIFSGYQNGFFFYDFSEQSNSYLPYIYMGQPLTLGENTSNKMLIMGRTSAKRTLNRVVSTERLQNNPILADSNFAVVQADGIVIAATDQNLLGHYFDEISPERRKQLEEQGMGQVIGDIVLAKEPITIIEGEKEPFFQFIYNGKLQLAYRAFVPLMNASVIVYLPKGAFFAREVGAFFLVYLMYGLIFIFGGTATYWLTIWLSRPLQQLSHVMGEVSKGNLNVRFVSQPFGYEVNFLGSAFNLTLNSLLENMQRLEDERVQRETYEREVKIAQKVQQNLLPTAFTPIREVEIASYYHFAHEVGGDFYDYSILHEKEEDKHISLTIADASGKGISSCLYALAARSFIRSAATLQKEVGKILAMANNAFLQDTGDTGMFVTVLMGVYSTKNSILTYYSCGHVPALVKRKNGEVIVLEHNGMAMGLMEVTTLQESKLTLEPGDIVLFYTSGLTEVANDKGIIFSQRRLFKTLEKNKWQTPQEMISGIISTVTRFAKDGILEEEITLLIMKINE